MFADGLYIPRTYYKEDIYEPTQKAIILHDGNKEQMIIEATYKGTMDDFAWLIPVPSYPNVEKSVPKIFEEIHYLTQPEYRRSPSKGVGYYGVSEKMMDIPLVTVHEQKQVGIYDVAILSSEDSKALLEWLINNDYKVSPEAESVLDYYIQKKWYFIASRINLAPYDAKLLESLRNINPEITNPENAVQLLTDDIVNYIMEKKDYDSLTAISDTSLNYDEDSSEQINSGSRGYDDYDYQITNPRSKSSVPSVLITKDEYNRHYEKYNGYYKSHLIEEIKSSIHEKLNSEINIPSSWECIETDYRQPLNSERCNVWYFTKDSEEYKLLKEAECGGYCKLILEEKSQYTAEDLASVAAYAITQGNEKIIAYFHTVPEKQNWYDNENDISENVKRDVKSRLYDTLEQKRNALRTKLEADLAAKYSQKYGKTFSRIDEISLYLAEKTSDDLKTEKSYSGSFIFGSGILSDAEYIEMEKLSLGDHDEISLKENIASQVKQVVYWKKNIVQQRLQEGTVQPLSIKFSSENIIYPLKISSANKGASEVLLYVFANHKTKVSGIEGFKTEYAKWIEPKDVKYTTELNKILDDKYFLTKFRKQLWSNEMTSDIIFEQAENNKEYRLVVYEKGYYLGWVFFVIVLLIFWGFLFGACFLPRMINNKIVKNKDSPFYASIKRIAVYAVIIPAGILLSAILPNYIGKVFGFIVEGLSEMFQFIFHILNFLGTPKLLTVLILILFGYGFIFLMIHLICSSIVSITRKLR